MIVSNTEVTTYNLCKKQHYFRFVEDLEPRDIPVNSPLGLGILGHEAFEAYYLEMMDGKSIESCLLAAKAVLEAKIAWLLQEAPEDFKSLERIAYLIGVFEAYAYYYSVEPFKVLAVEKVYRTNITDTIGYGMKIDLLVEWTKGVDAGEPILIDHKFVYNFKSRSELEMDCQLPKYKKTLRDNGIRISHSYLNQVRYREMKAPTAEDMFLRMPMYSTPTEVATIWDEQRDTAEEIAERKKPIRTQHLLTCRGCMFERLCKTELLGLDTKHMRITDYKPNTYGYTDMSQAGDHF